MISRFSEGSPVFLPSRLGIIQASGGGNSVGAGFGERVGGLVSRCDRRLSGVASRSAGDCAKLPVGRSELISETKSLPAVVRRRIWVKNHRVAPVRPANLDCPLLRTFWTIHGHVRWEALIYRYFPATTTTTWHDMTILLKTSGEGRYINIVLHLAHNGLCRFR